MKRKVVDRLSVVSDDLVQIAAKEFSCAFS
jgi:hypothetical protein